MSVLARRIRVPGLAADFHVPRGWPTPTDRWIRENLFWRPPRGWTPRRGLRGAPAGWNYWLPNPHWKATSAVHYRRIAPWMRAAAWLGLAGLVVTAISSFLGFPMPLVALGPIIVFAALTCVVVHTVLSTRLNRRILGELEAVAERRRTERLTREYQQYLRATA